MTDVAVAIITDDHHRVLIARRKSGKVMAGCWEFPGGKLEVGESPEETLVRELMEEMNVVISVGEYIDEITYDYPWGKVRLLAYEASILKNEIQLLDHDAYAWVWLDEMQHYGMTPADEPLIASLAKRLNSREDDETISHQG